jgi:hypothetical protein
MITIEPSINDTNRQSGDKKISMQMPEISQMEADTLNFQSVL